MNDLDLEGERIRRSFDRAAQSYDQAAALQRRVADSLLTHVASTAPQTIIDAGCGTGYATATLAEHFPLAQLHALDLAPAMLHSTRQRLSAPALICADIQALPLASHSIDLFYSSLMLQWCNRLDLAFADVHRSLRHDGEFVFSTFGPDTLSELRDSFSDGHTHVSHFPDVTELSTLLTNAGFVNIDCHSQTEVLHYSDARALMQELKAIGAHNATAGRARGLTGKYSWQAMLANYETRRSAAGLPASYELIYARARAN